MVHWILSLTIFLCGLSFIYGATPNLPTNVTVEIQVLNYVYAGKKLANGLWCSSTPLHEHCSPAFQLCFQPVNSRDCLKLFKFGGHPHSQYVHKNAIAFGSQLTNHLSNPIKFTVTEWVAYPKFNVTITDTTFDRSKLLSDFNITLGSIPAPNRSADVSTDYVHRLHESNMDLTFLLNFQVYCTPGFNRPGCIQDLSIDHAGSN